VNQRFSSELLRSLRNELSIYELIRFRLDLPSKEREGYLRFLCPRCNEFHTATNPKTNLARCFRCGVNFNPIDMVMAVKACGFVDAVKILVPLFEAQRKQSAHR
jgi:DNA primase